MTSVNKLNQLCSLKSPLYSAIRCCFGRKRTSPVDPTHSDEIPVYQYASKTGKTHQRIYTWGVAAHGAQGEQDFVRPRTKSLQPRLAVKRPHRLEFGERHKVTHVACGYGFTLFAVQTKTKNKIFGCGLNTDSQIGYQTARKDAPLGMLLEPVPIPVPFLDLGQTKVQDIGGGRAHSVVATDEGVFTFGHNGYGQCGRPIITDEVYSGSRIIYKIPELEGVKIRNVVCGQDHSMFLTTGGKVLSCGWSADGQTGVGHYDNQPIVTPVVGDVEKEDIVKVACSGDCVLAVNATGELFGWGNNEYGQLTFATDDMQLHTSRRMKLPSYVGKIKDIAVGGTACIVLNDKGNVFSWGFGILGKGPALEQSSVPEEIPPILFGRDDVNQNRKVVKVFAGINSFYALNDNGDVYAWGKNKDFSLGVNHNKTQFFPFKVSLPCKLETLGVGVDHVVAMCRSFT